MDSLRFLFPKKVESEVADASSYEVWMVDTQAAVKTKEDLMLLRKSDFARPMEIIENGHVVWRAMDGDYPN